MKASVWIHRNDPSKAPMRDKRLSKMGMASAMMNDRVQLKATQALIVSESPPEKS
jgi:hypothetical protein